MTFAERLGYWFVKRRIIAAYKKGKTMKPLPKWIGWTSLAGTLGTLCLTIAGLVPPKIAAVIGGLGTFLSSLSHSLPGTGGKPQ